MAVDAVGSTSSLDLALRSTRAGGRVVLSGMPAAGADLSPAWFRELEVAGTYAARGADFDTALQLAGRPRWTGVVGRPIRCTGGARPSTTPSRRGRLGSVKVCFDVRSTA